MREPFAFTWENQGYHWFSETCVRGWTVWHWERPLALGSGNLSLNPQAFISCVALGNSFDLCDPYIFLSWNDCAKDLTIGTSQVVQWLRRHAFPAEAAGLIPGQETKISQAMRPKEKKSWLFCRIVAGMKVKENYRFESLDETSRIVRVYYWIKPSKPCLIYLLFSFLFFRMNVCACVPSCFSRIWLFVTLWTVAYQAPQSTGFSRQEYRSGLPCRPPGDLLDPWLLCLLDCRRILYPLSHQGSPFHMYVSSAIVVNFFSKKVHVDPFLEYIFKVV